MRPCVVFGTAQRGNLPQSAGVYEMRKWKLRVQHGAKHSEEGLY